ncbi:MAG TPA: sugar transferase, partial [Candidatus Woesebacteria bacterium]|nr:sugar transferase [Candidatus Woesebacteria bacterium]
TIDLIGSSLILIITSPLFLIIALAIKISSPGPVFFKQKRAGKNHQEFLMYKFRTMYTGNNDERLRKNYPHLWKKYKANGWKLPMAEDPRITPVGRILRFFSIDELPQLINILKGEMSLVGPRAYREEELEEYEKKFPHTQKYIEDIRSVRPGLSGVWQTSGRNELPFEKRAKLDSDYVRHRSFRQEILILLKTPFSMISRW